MLSLLGCCSDAMSAVGVLVVVVVVVRFRSVVVMSTRLCRPSPRILLLRVILYQLFVAVSFI